MIDYYVLLWATMALKTGGIHHRIDQNMYEDLKHLYVMIGLVWV